MSDEDPGPVAVPGTEGPGSRRRGLALAGAGVVVALPPALFGLNLASYAVGSPDSPRFFVGLVAVLALGLAAAPLYAAGRVLAGSGWRPPLTVPTLSALALLPLIVVSAPREYDDGTPMPALIVGVAGVLVAGTALSARAPRLAVRLGVGSLAAFYLACLLLDAASLLPAPAGGPPALSPGTDPAPLPVPAPPPPR